MIDTSEEIFMFNVEEELKKLPRKPGVYIMRDDKDVILYVGKAINLHNRVRSYFRENIGRGPAIDQMVSLIARFEYIVTDSELEALVLENNLIKENSPKYNTLLKDDKTYPYIKVTVGEDYPRILFSRTMKKDKSRYFGPYTSAAAVKDTIELLNKLYQLRTCNRVLPRDIGIERPCLNYHIKQCLAPCQGYVSKEEYRQQVAGALEFLNGNYSPILKDLEEKMKKAAEAMEFEDAARYRDLLSSVRQVSQKQKITEGVGEDKDILALYQDETEAVVQVFFVRDGKLIGREHYYMTHVPENNKPAILQDFVKQFYAGTPFIPRELMLQYEIEDAELIEKWLSERKGSRVYLKVPKIGSKEKLVELAAQNAKLVLSQDREKLKREEGRTIGAVKEISDLLQLPLTGTARMEAYDISNINGFENVGSMVVYEKGKPKRSDYRKFKIKSVSGPDDYACMREVLTRRFRHGMEESKELEEQEMDQEYGSFTKFPDLILMDGGRGQVNIALSVLEELGIGFVAFSPLANGLLSGRYNLNSTFEPGTDYRSSMPQFRPESFDANKDLFLLLHNLAEEKQATPAQISLAWMLCKKSWIVPIPGTRKFSRLKENAEAAHVILSADEVRQIDAALSFMNMSDVFGGSPITEKSSTH